MRRRLILPLVVLSALLAVPTAALAHGYRVGMSDQQATMFLSPLYQRLHVKLVRYVAPWDVMKQPDQAAAMRDFLAGARLTHASPLVSFSGYVARNPHKLPSRHAFTKAFEAFHKAYPWVKDISPWNEANHKSSAFANPSARRAAQYYEIVRKHCRHCDIVGVDVLDGPSHRAVRDTVRYVKQFRHLTRKHPAKYWGLHDYSDTNRFAMWRTKKITRAMRGGQVWLTETGGVVRLGSSFPYSTSRAAKALRYMFKVAKRNHRVKRMYVYQWSAPTDPAATFDAGLMNPDGTPRPGYRVVEHGMRHHH